MRKIPYPPFFDTKAGKTSIYAAWGIVVVVFILSFLFSDIERWIWVGLYILLNIGLIGCIILGIKSKCHLFCISTAISLILSDVIGYMLLSNW